jgi:hypothetical protein
LPLRDAVELFNPTEQPADIGGWFLSDDAETPRKFRIPDGTVIPGAGYVVFTQDHFNTTPGAESGFAFGARGDEVYLFSADPATGELTGYSHGFEFGASAARVSFGRHLTSQREEHFVAQRAPTFGVDNVGPKIGPVVINEIMYHPGPGNQEFIELKNITDQPVPLYDPAHPTNRWRIGGLGYEFPPGVILGPRSLLVVALIEPSLFKAAHGVPANVEVLGPYRGALQDSGERIELQRPGEPDTNGLAYIDVDVVRYNDKAPWPPTADGGGPSLQRIDAATYGNDPINWSAAAPTPGREYGGGALPVITLHPRSQSAVAFQAVTMTAAAAGPGLVQYQWLRNGTPLVEQTNTTLLLTNLQPVQAGSYLMVAFNEAGSAASAPAILSVNVPAIITLPPTNKTVIEGANATFQVSAIGTGRLYYQWRLYDTNLVGETNTSLALTKVDAFDDGPYTVAVTNAYGSALSQEARLTVLIKPVIVTPPLSQTIVAGDTVTLTVVATGSMPLRYRWLRSGAPLAGETNEFLKVVTVQTNVNLTNVYTVSITNAASAGRATATNATVIVLADTDGDHMPDDWEKIYGFNFTDATDGALDPDGDRLTNWQEYLAGTDPTNVLSYLRLERITVPGQSNVAWLEFYAAANRTYSLLYADSLPAAAWSKLTDVVAGANSRLAIVMDPSPASVRRFYRLVAPKRP